MKAVSKASPTHQSIQLRRRSEKIKIDVNYISDDPQNKENHNKILNDLLLKDKFRKRSSEKLPLSSSKKNIKIVNKSAVVSKEASLQKRKHSKDNPSQSKSKECFRKKISEELEANDVPTQINGLILKLKFLSQKFKQKPIKDMVRTNRAEQIKLFQEYRHKLKSSQVLGGLLKSLEEYLSQIWKRIAEFGDIVEASMQNHNNLREAHNINTHNHIDALHTHTLHNNKNSQHSTKNSLSSNNKKGGKWKDLDVTTMLSSTAYFGEWKGPEQASARPAQLKQKGEKLLTDKPALDQSIDISESGSECTYLADPSIQVSVKWLRSDLKEKLQLNLSNLDSIRKREMPV